MLDCVQSEKLIAVNTYSKSDIYGWAAHQKAVKGHVRSVLMALASRADKTGSCCPRQDQLAGDLGIGIATVKRCIAKLIKAKLITAQFRYNKRGYRASSRYVLGINLIPSGRPALGSPKDQFDPDTSNNLSSSWAWKVGTDVRSRSYCENLTRGEISKGSDTRKGWLS